MDNIYDIKPNAITNFKDLKFSFLSNMHLTWVLYDGRIYKSSETAYQASKFKDPAIKDKLRCMNGYSAKRKAREYSKLIYDGFHDDKIEIMRAILKQKFPVCGMGLTWKLMGTGDRQLVEVVRWDDPFWGVYNGRGANHLGELLMQRRDELNG